MNETTENQQPEVQQPELSPEQQAMMAVMDEIARRVGHAYVQDAAQLMASIAFEMQRPVTFVYDMGGVKGLALGVTGDEETIQKIAQAIELVIPRKKAEAPASAPEAPETGNGSDSDSDSEACPLPESSAAA